MEITIDSHKVSLIWLRDNCRCDECYNWETNQRKSNDIRLNNIEIKNISINEEKVTLTWIDGHISTFDKRWIISQLRMETKPELILWKGKEIKDLIPKVSYTYLENGAEKLTKSLLQLGVGVVTDVPPTLEDTEKTATKIGPVMHTLFGGMWSLDNTRDFEKYQDTAYTNLELAAHTDNTYFTEPAGLQVFHCLKAADKGGATILLDGFKAAQMLRNENSDYYECLKSTFLEWQYITSQHYYTSVKPIIDECPISGAIQQIRYNIYDRSPRIKYTSENEHKFYKSLKCFREIVNDPQMKCEVPLSPGTVLFINNWRVFHGRKGFLGRRIVVGCYIGMNALLSRGRMLKLIV